MKIVAVAGLESPYLDRLEQVLNNAGMASASILLEDESITFVQWHDTLINRLGIDLKDARGDTQYHNELVLKINEICSTHKDGSLWGWADHNFVWTLDVWLQNLPNLHALFPCYGPDRWLASRLVDETQHLRASEALNQWFEVHQQLLRVHFRYPGRTVLVDGYDCLAFPRKFLNYLAEKWQLPVDCDSSQALELPELDPLAHFLAQQISQANAEVWTLQQTIEASLEVFSPDEPQGSRNDLNLLEDALQGYRETQLSRSHLERVEALLDEARREISLLQLRHTELKELHQATLFNEQGLTAELENLTTAYRDQLYKGQELDNVIGELKQKLSIQTKEAVEYQGRLDTLALELEASRNSEKHLQAELEAMNSVKVERNALSENNHQLQTKYENAQAESVLLLEQLHAVQEELEKVFLKSQEADRKITELQVERDKQAQLATERQGQIGTLTAQRDTEAKAKAQALAQRDVEAKAKAEAQARVGKLKQAQQELTAASDALTQEKAALSQARDVEAKARAAAQSQLVAQDQLTKELRDQTKALTQERDALNKRVKEMEKTLNIATATESELQKQTDKVMKLEAELKDNQEENTLLLEQLHMVQEELECLFLKTQDSGQNVGELTAECDRLAQLVMEKQTLIESLTQARDDLSKLAKDRRAQIDAREKLVTDLRERIKVLGADCNVQLKLSNQKQKQIDSLQGLQAEINTLRQDNQTLRQQVQGLQDKLEQSSRAATRVNGGESGDDQGATAREDIVTELKQRIENLENLAKSRRSQIDQRDEVIRDLRDRCKNLQTELKAQAKLAMTLGESLVGPGRKPETTADLQPDEMI